MRGGLNVSPEIGKWQVRLSLVDGVSAMSGMYSRAAGGGGRRPVATAGNSLVAAAVAAAGGVGV